MGQTRREGGTTLFRVHARNGVVLTDEDGCISSTTNSMGTYIHGIFDNPEIVRFWLNRIGPRDIEISNLEGLEARNRQYDLLVQHFEQYIAIETIDYPIDIIIDAIEELDFGICMDVGHLILNGHDIIRFYQRHENRIAIIHLHGVRGTRDHASLEHLPAGLLQSFLGLLQEYRRTISLELFSFNTLSSSLRHLEKCWQSISATSRSGS